MSEKPSNVIVHPTVSRKVGEDICPKCGGELDTGWECNDCGYDAIWATSHTPADQEGAA